MASRLFQTILKDDAGRVLCGHVASIRLNPAAIDSAHGLRYKDVLVTSAAATADVPALISISLEINADLLDPPDSYYSLNAGKGLTWYWHMVAGSGVQWLDDPAGYMSGPGTPVPVTGVTDAQLAAAIAAQAAADSGTYARLDFLAQDTDNVYFPAQNAGMVTDLDGAFYFSPGYAAVAKLVADTDGVAYPVAIGA